MDGYNAATALYWVACLIAAGVVVLYLSTLRRILREGRWRDMWLALGIVSGFSGTVVNTSLWGTLRLVSPFSTVSGSWWAVTLGFVSMVFLAVAALCHVRAHAVVSGWSLTFPRMFLASVTLWAALMLAISAAGLGR